jgi:ribose transport system substrate-binding protein
VQVVGNRDAGTVQKVIADAIATHGNLNGAMVQKGTNGALTAMKNAGHPVVPVGGDAGNGARRRIAECGYLGGRGGAGAGDVGGAAGGCGRAAGRERPAADGLPADPEKPNAELVAGTDFFPELPDTFHTTAGHLNCFAVFTPKELLGQTPDNV